MRTVLSKVLLSTALAAVLAAILAVPASAQSGPEQGPGGPILVVADPGFGRYYAEILRGEGLNEFTVAGTGSLTNGALASYQSVVLGETALNGGQLAALSAWVQGGGNLVAMRPDKQLAGLLGLADAGGTRSDAYIGVNTSAVPGAGITGATMQYHGPADNYNLNGATEVARLYSDANNATGNPAVTLRGVGGAGGQAAAFTYDLAKSVIQTRQGNPAYAGEERDGQTPPVKRSDDLFYPDFVDRDPGKIQIPHADEQQRLLANLLTHMNTDRMPLPRFWYLPRGEKAAVIMTGDDHAVGGTDGHFAAFRSESANGCSVADWQCIRGTSYVYPNTPLDNPAADNADGFEIALHLNTGCADFTAATIAQNWLDQLPAFRSAYPSLPAPVTNRTHCIVWSDWDSEAKAALPYGVRFDTNYYYWPAPWVQDRPGMFTGSGMPQRFAEIDGSVIDVYQAATQMTDESAINYPVHAATLLNNALGTQGFYGVFTANIHTDREVGPAIAIIDEAQARGVPVVTAKQMLEWVDGRNASSFQSLGFQGNRLTFNLLRAAGARGLEAMVPMAGPTGGLTGLSRNGAPVGYEVRNVKGVAYAVYSAEPGAYLATYGNEPPAPPPPAGGGGSAGGGSGSTGGGSGSTGGGSGSTNSGSDRTAPRVRISPTRIRVAPRELVSLKAKCPRGEIRCRVALSLRDGRRTVGRKTVTIRGGKSAWVSVRLSRAASRKFARARTLRLTAVASARDAAGNRATTRTAIRLSAPRSPA